LVVDPNNIKIIYAGAGSSGSGSGVYKSEDSGLTWTLVSTNLPDEDVVALAAGLAQPATLYAVLGGAGGLYASTDGAVTWKRMGNPASAFRLQAGDRPRECKEDLCYRSGFGAARSLDGGATWTRINQGYRVLITRRIPS